MRSKHYEELSTEEMEWVSIDRLVNPEAWATAAGRQQRQEEEAEAKAKARAGLGGGARRPDGRMPSKAEVRPRPTLHY